MLGILFTPANLKLTVDGLKDVTRRLDGLKEITQLTIPVGLEISGSSLPSIVTTVTYDTEIY